MSRAVVFSMEWKNTSGVEADAKPFFIELFHIFGISQKGVTPFSLEQ
jgi:hypothetical protein